MVLRMANPWKHPKTGVYYHRKRVPKDLVSVVGSILVKTSLGTKDPAEARGRYREKDMEVESRWSALRDGIRNGPIYLDDAQVEAIAGEIYREYLARFGNVRSMAIPNGHWAFLSIACDEADGTATWRGARPPQEALRHCEYLVVEKLEAKGVQADADSMHRLRVATNRALKQAVKLYFQQVDGDWRPDPDAARFPGWEAPPTPDGKKPDELSLDEVWEKIAKGYSAATRKRFRPILDGLMASAKKSDLRAITNDDVQAWMDKILESGTVSPRSFSRNNLAAVKSFYNKLKGAKKVTENPAADVRVVLRKLDKGRKMRGFRDEEAIKILEASLLPPPPKLHKHYALARRWVPWLCAYTGARVNEITQARACDIQFVETYWCILITPEAGTQKTCEERLVPLHPHLIEQGFLTFARTKRDDQPLFAAQSSKGKTTPSELVGAHLAKWVRNLGIKDIKVAPNHGWRHRFKTKARLFIGDARIDAIQGHAPATEGRKYGDFDPPILGPEIAKLPKILLPAQEHQAA